MSDTTTEQTPLLTKEQVEERLNITRSHLEYLIRSRTIPFVKVGRFVRFDPARIDAWIAENTKGDD